MRVENTTRIIGTLGTEKAECWSADESREAYYLTKIRVRGMDLPILVSEYQIDRLLGKHVEVQAFIRSFYSRKLDQYRISSLFAHFIKECPDWDESLEDRRITVRGCVAEDAELNLNESNVTRLNFRLQCALKFEDKFTVIVPCRAFDMNARKLSPLKEGTVVTVDGYLMSNGNRLRVVCEKVDVERRGD